MTEIVFHKEDADQRRKKLRRIIEQAKQQASREAQRAESAALLTPGPLASTAEEVDNLSSEFTEADSTAASDGATPVVRA